MKKYLAATLMIIGAIFSAAYAICMAIFKVERISDMATSEFVLLLLCGLAAIISGAILFYLESKQKKQD